MPNLTFLQASVPLTKTYAEASGQLIKTPYPMTWEFTSNDESAANLPTFMRALKKHAALGHCLLKGNVGRPLINESRAGSTDSNAATEYIVLDLDGLPASTHLEDKTITVTIDYLLAAMGLADISYILQWSASYGVVNDALRAHVFMQLSKPAPAPLLKQWLIQLNHTTPVLRAGMSLTKTGNTISWPLDISACQNDKLIYIAPPVFEGMPDPLAGKQRIQYITRKTSTLTLPAAVYSTAQNRELTDKRIAELREAAGLPKRKVAYKMHGSTEIMIKPDSCIVTDVKAERGFVYFNLNGGDSWAYYHPENNPDYIYNFKGEPAYLTKELLPDYWAGLQSQANQVNSTGVLKLAFLDPKTDRYWRGTYDTTTDHLDLEPTGSALALMHHAKANGIVIPDGVIPEWSMTFDPHDNVRVDIANRLINTFQPTQYMRAQARQTRVIPKTIHKVIYHVCGSDNESFERFINWLAYVLQKRDRPLTAWIFHGVPGTGKGTMLSKILRPIWGHAHVATPRMKELDKEFNSFIDKSLLVAVDEVETDALQNERGAMADLRRYTTEDFVPLRRMHRDAKLVRNYTAWLFFSNYSAPVRVTKNDRRFNVACYQPEKLIISDAELIALESELQAFHDYLLYYPVNIAEVFEPLLNQERDDLMDLTESAIDTVSNALLTGNMQWLLDQLPATTRPVGSSMIHNLKTDDYRAVLADLVTRTDRSTGACNISREELRAIYEYTVGKIPESPNKFTSLLKHHRVVTKKIRIGTDLHYGVRVEWKDIKQWPQYLKLFDTGVKKLTAVR